MPNAFRTVDIQRLIRRADQLQTQAERDPDSVRLRDWQAYRRELTAYVVANTGYLYANFREIELVRRRGILPGDIPEVLATVRDRYITQWNQTLTRAFSTAYDSLNAGERNRSILQRVTRFLQNLLGIRGVPSMRRGGTFTYRGKKHWNYTAMYLASTKPLVSVKVSQIVSRVSNVNFRDANLLIPVVLIKEGSRFYIYEGVERVLKALSIEQTTLPARVLTPSDLKKAEVRVVGFARARADRTTTWSMRFGSYIQLLFKTIPRNLERDLMRLTIQALEERALYLITGGVIENSAKTCRFVNNRILTPDALKFVTDSSALNDHLFHPNCRHRLQPPPPNFQGRIWDVQDIQGRVRNGELR